MLSLLEVATAQERKALMIVRDPIEQVYQMFLEECEQGHIGVSCAPNSKMCSVAECRSSSKARRGMNCLPEAALPAHYRNIGGVCNWEGFEDFLFKEVGGDERVTKNNGGLFLRMVRHINADHGEILKNLTEEKERTGTDETEVGQLLTSYEILHNPSQAREELCRIETFFGTKLFQQVEATTSKVEKLHELVKQRGGGKESVYYVSESSQTEAFMEVSSTKTKEKSQKHHGGKKKNQNLRSARKKRNQPSISPAQVPSPILLEHLKKILCPSFQEIESVVTGRRMLESGQRYAQIFGQSRCSSGIWQ